MEGEWLSPSDYRRRREREDLAARRRIDREKADPDAEQALIAWMAAGATIPWEQFRREWIKSRK